MTTNEYIRNVKENDWQPFDGKLWQRNYYEHIIRDEAELNTKEDILLITLQIGKQTEIIFNAKNNNIWNNAPNILIMYDKILIYKTDNLGVEHI